MPTLGQGERAVREDVDLGARVGAHQRARRADGLGEPVGEVPGLRLGDRGQGALAVAPERGGNLGLDARLDHHDLGALAQPPDEPRGLRPRNVEARGTDIARLHGRRGVEHQHGLAGAVARHRDGRPRERDGQREEGQDLEDQERIALEPLEERGRLAVAERRIPQEQARHPSLAPTDLEEIEQHQRDGQGEERERERGEKAHATTRPRNCDRTKSSTELSDVKRW